ncbi:FtsX-like permease family protein [Paenibacillus aurantiacus]|uniref:FtsX-like permease family protein n=1 Tax=Paenibacillus aurantiacus TaxID=1936118 RepID=A0ABV5KR76_9BACL
MALWTMILRKMAKNKWLQLNLWFGLTVCVALFSSMPLYSEAILQRTLIKELERIQHQSGAYPGFVRISTSVSASKMDEKTRAAIARADQYVQRIPQRMGLEALSVYRQRFTQRMKVYGADATEQEKQSQKTAGGFKALSDAEKRVRLIDGRMPEVREDGIFEALVTQKFLISAKRKLTEELIVESPEGERFRVIPVGIMDTDPAADPYLPFLTTEVPDGFLIPFAQFEKEFTIGGKARVSDLEWRLALNYNQLTVENVEAFTQASKDIKRYFRGRLGVDEINIPASETVASYAGKQEKLDVMMLSLYSPVMLMLAFYLYMAANLVIDRQKTEISVLRSRGASRLQIMASFTAESLLLGGSALAVGPFLGVTFTKLLGASNGFLTFVQRSALEVTLTSTAYKVAALAVAGAIALILIPAFMATRVTIVGHKQQMARLTKLSFWHKTGLDLVLVAIAVYLLYNFNNRQEDLKRLALDQDALQVDPLLFLMPALFALGGGLLVLRVYPWLIRLLFWAGRGMWPPALYSTLIQISRSSGQYLTIKVFLIMTVATGLFSANAARTINDNMESKIQYNVGADMALTTRWASDAPAPVYAGGAQQAQTDLGIAETRRTQYTEPPFQPFRELKGVEAAARVFKKEARYTAGSEKGSGATTLLGIDTAEFGRTAWMKNGLLEYPINSYLNLIAPNPKAVLISRSLAKEAKVAPGDPIRLTWDGLDQAQFTVYGIVDYWPSWNPLPAGGEGEGGEAATPHLVVGHLTAIQNRLAVEPYEVWLKLREGVSSQEIYDQLAANKLSVTSLRDAHAELVTSKNDPFRLAINGVMTLGFVISMLISFFGFLLFWLLNLSGRTLQYGVLRAMGIPFPQIIGMLISEQFLTSGAAVLIGVIIGNATSELFVPLFEMSFATTEQVPPFAVVYRLRDYVQLYGIVGFTLTVGLLILGYRLSRTRIAQALKLGEE